MPQPHINKCHRTPSSPGSSVSIYLPRSIYMLLLHETVSSNARPLQRKHGQLMLLDPCVRGDQKDHTQSDTQKSAHKKRRILGPAPSTKGATHWNPPRAERASTKQVTQFHAVKTQLRGQKHGGQALTAESVAMLRQLDRAACVNCGGIRQDVPITDSDAQLLGELQRASATNGHSAMYCIAVHHGMGRKP